MTATSTSTYSPVKIGGSRSPTKTPRLGMSDSCLLDTHVLLWAVAEPHRLAAGIRSIIENQKYTVSVASLWELINKKGRRDSPLNDPVLWWDRYVVQPRTPVIPIRSRHVLYLDRLPWR